MVIATSPQAGIAAWSAWLPFGVCHVGASSPARVGSSKLPCSTQSLTDAAFERSGVESRFDWCASYRSYMYRPRTLWILPEANSIAKQIR